VTYDLDLQNDVHYEELPPKRVIIKQKKSGFAAAMGWFLAVGATAGLAAFWYGVYMPLQQRTNALATQLDETHQRNGLIEQEFNQVNDDARSLRAKNQALEAEMAELQQAHAAAIAEKEAAVAALKRVQDELSGSLGKEIASGDVAVTRRGDEVVIDVSDDILFASGESALSEHGKEVLKSVAATMKGMPDRVFQIGGHTDSEIPSKRLQETYPTNWELSTARATNVVRFLEESAGVSGKQLLAAGFARHRPVASNRSSRGKQKNRRIEIVVQKRK
jgi:chemotaxis protein MotB